MYEYVCCLYLEEIKWRPKQKKEKKRITTKKKRKKNYNKKNRTCAHRTNCVWVNTHTE